MYQSPCCYGNHNHIFIGLQETKTWNIQSFSFIVTGFGGAHAIFKDFMKTTCEPKNIGMLSDQSFSILHVYIYVRPNKER